MIHFNPLPLRGDRPHTQFSLCAFASISIHSLCGETVVMLLRERMHDIYISIHSPCGETVINGWKWTG